MAIEVERTISAHGVARELDRLAQSRGKPQVNWTDDAKEFSAKEMIAWAHERVIQLYPIQQNKPNQSTYSEAFRRRLRDECPNQHWSPTLLYACPEIGTRRPEHNENDRRGS
ncbi:hypothetical protein A7X83_13985 [Stenotrophomonas maltophilia]|uniref:Transposase n=1 Tax=Stenotrophomonas maltophilia TaxID=40324 RepID=A0A2W6HZG6_STEMA|nr:hypothetical protein A7X83_13985 [Stenotrophomonas maltophilia]